MGTEMHVDTQALRGSNWESVGSLDVWRNYTLYNWLTGFCRSDRSPVVPIAEPRGYPAGWDRAEYEDDATHQTWLTSDEILRATQPDVDTIDASAIRDFVAAVAALVAEHGAVRLVIGLHH